MVSAIKFLRANKGDIKARYRRDITSMATQEGRPDIQKWRKYYGTNEWLAPLDGTMAEDLDARAFGKVTDIVCRYFTETLRELGYNPKHWNVLNL